MIAPVQLPILPPDSAPPDDSLPPVDSGRTASPAAASPEAPDLIPARMLNEFTYCPRLGYLEFVQGEFADNLETLEGTFGHRRVDQPSRGEVPSPLGHSAGDSSSIESLPHAESTAEIPSTDQSSSTTAAPSAAKSTGKAKRGSRKGAKDAPANADIEPIHARSVMLSAPIEGLIAKMDLLEMEGNVVTPVDYKRGSLPDLPEGAWEPERVQLCAQGLILREAGYQCDSGVLYYIESRRRVVIPFDDALIARTRELAKQFRQTAAAGVMPKPLVESPKCPRCSLVGICLPDETNLLTHPGPVNETTEVRRLLPARDDALPLYIQEQGASLGKDGDQLVIKKKTETLAKVKLYNVSQISLMGNVQVSAQALREIAARGIPICHFSYGGWFHAMTVGHTHKNVELRMRQYAVAADPRESLALAKAFVIGKVKNCRTMLRRHLSGDDRPELQSLADLVTKAERAGSAESLLGIEGMAAKVYFAGFAKLLDGGEEFDIEGRNRRPPKDPVNALLSFVYSLLTKELTIVLQAVGFDPHLGFYHRPRYGRPSLALDLTEEFRPLIADSTVLTLVNNGEVGPGDFIRRGNAVALTDAARRAVITTFERRLDHEITHPLFGYRVSYRRILEVQARLLARTLLGEIPEYPNFCTR